VRNWIEPVCKSFRWAAFGFFLRAVKSDRLVAVGHATRHSFLGPEIFKLITCRIRVKSGLFDLDAPGGQNI
jgi:hypothetical protein